MAKLGWLTIIAVVALALAIGTATGIAGGAVYAVAGGVLNENSAVGAEHANDHSAHPKPICDDLTLPTCD